MRNNLKLTGRLVNDVKVNTTSSGKAVTTIRLAVQNDFPSKDGEYESEFFNVTLWNKAANKTARIAHKGDLVEIDARLTNNQEDGKDNIVIVGNDIDLLSKNKSNTNVDMDLEEEMDR